MYTAVFLEMKTKTGRKADERGRAENGGPELREKLRI